MIAEPRKIEDGRCYQCRTEQPERWRFVACNTTLVMCTACLGDLVRALHRARFIQTKPAT